VKACGLRKNTTRSERAAIVKSLAAGGDGGGEAVMVVGPIRMNKDKLGRWKKEIQGMDVLQNDDLSLDDGDGMYLFNWRHSANSIQ
jgi:hypothetical protein